MQNIFKIKDKIFPLKLTDFYIMGILNVTPDSFSDGGKNLTTDAILYNVEKMINDGADIIDVGGESTRPNYTPVSENEEIERTEWVIGLIKKNFDVIISLDTYKSKVLKYGISSGVDMANDIWGLRYDDEYAKIVKDSGISLCIMHNRKNAEYDNFVCDAKEDLQQSINIAQKNDIDKDRILIDPGIGFAKSYQNNLTALKDIAKFKTLGFPILLGTSNKSVIGLTLNVPTNLRQNGTIATTLYGALNGVNFFRVHDVKSNFESLKMISTILQQG